MKKLLSLVFFGLATSLALATPDARRDSRGLNLSTTTTDKVGFHGITPVAQRAGAAQAAITDSTTGTAGTTAAAGTSVSTVTIPLSSLATGLSTSALDLLTNFTPGYKFKLIKLEFVTTVVGTGSSASQVFNATIGSTATTGGVLTVNLTATNTIGKVTSATAITALNTGSASDTISLKMAASGTAFTAGGGYFVITLQNMDSADAHASQLNLLNEIRASLVQKGIIKGGS